MTACAKPTAAAKRPIWRIFLSSTARDLEDHRRVVAETIDHYGQVVLRMETFGARPGAPLAECLDKVRQADAVVVLVAHRYGSVPSRGGDGGKSFTWLEAEAAVARRKPVFAYLVDPAFAWPHGKEQDRLEEADDPKAVQQAVRRLEELKAWLRRRTREEFTTPNDLAIKVSRDLGNWIIERIGSPAIDSGYRIRRHPRPAWPGEPYPLLRPYSHPSLFAGRKRETSELRRLVKREVPILGLYAVSGAGKSSLLRAGLIPGLRGESWPVAYVEHPHEARLAARLVGDLLREGRAAPEIADDDFESFVRYLKVTRELAAGRRPVLILDQFESLLRLPYGSRRRARVGALLAASVQRQPGVGGPLCRWVLAYREEFHGRVEAWLGDLLGEAERISLPGIGGLPRDLSTAERFHSWSMPVLGRPGPRAADRRAAARGAFLEAITRPLGRRRKGAPRYPWRFAGDGAERLAAAFAEAREDQPEAPLVPELQVVLAHLLEEAGPAPAEIEVPQRARAVIDRALEEHLHRALHAAFAGRDEPAAQGRSRLLLALHALTDARARRGGGLPSSRLEAALGPPDAARALERLARPDLRLLVPRDHETGLVYELSHDRMAEAIVRAVKEERRLEELGVDPEILALRPYVRIMTDLYLAGETEQATDLPPGQRRAIAAHAAALLDTEDRPHRRRWWRACEQRRAFESAEKKAREGSPAQVLEGLAALVGGDGIVGEAWARRRARDVWRGRYWPLIFDAGALSLAPAGRDRVILEASRSALALAGPAPCDLETVGAVAWALDCYCARSDDAGVRQRAAGLRAALLEPLRARHPPPAALDEELWPEIPGGSFEMGTPEGAKPPGSPKERPRHRVTLSPFRMLAHPVTNRQLRRLVPKRLRPWMVDPGEPWDKRLPDNDRPTVGVSWYAAYAYGAWLGGRLPTEAEWEYAARGDWPHPYCTRTGRRTKLGRVAWYRDNAKGVRKVMRLNPNPWGLYDLHGNVWEWVVDVVGDYPAEPQTDPWGADTSRSGRARHRVVRGGCYSSAPWWLRTACRHQKSPVLGFRYPDVGFRVVLPGGP